MLCFLFKYHICLAVLLRKYPQRLKAYCKHVLLNNMKFNICPFPKLNTKYYSVACFRSQGSESPDRFGERSSFLLNMIKYIFKSQNLLEITFITLIIET